MQWTSGNDANAVAECGIIRYRRRNRRANRRRGSWETNEQAVQVARNCHAGTLLAAFAGYSSTLAQSGSTGGTIAIPNKTLSGERTTEPRTPASLAQKSDRPAESGGRVAVHRPKFPLRADGSWPVTATAGISMASSIDRDFTGAFQRELCGNGAARTNREYRRRRCRRYQHFLHANPWRPNIGAAR